MSETQHRPAPPAPQPSTVASEPATVQACTADYDGRSGLTNEHPSSLGATPQTYGRKLR